METAIDRGAHRGFVFGQAVPLSPGQALGIYTVGGAAVLGRGADVGRIVPGYRADLAIFDENPLETATGALVGTLPSMVCVAGQITLLAPPISARPSVRCSFGERRLGAFS
jgi:predicted amidohydrolase YtcJ